MRVLRILALLVLIAGSCGVARAEIAVAPTLEWLADTCSHIGVCSSAQITWDPSASDQVPRVTIRGRWTRQLRGAFPDTFAFEHPVSITADGRTEIVAQDGDTFLVFARETGDGDIRQEHVINLSRPLRRSKGYTAFRPDFTVLADGGAILSIVKLRVRSHPARPQKWGEDGKNAWTHGVHVPYPSPAHDALFSRSECILIVPDDQSSIAKNHALKDRLLDEYWTGYYVHALVLAFFLLVLVSVLIHAASGIRLYQDEAMAHATRRSV